MHLLDSIRTPADVQNLDRQQLEDLAAELRCVLIETVSHNGGHLGPNLGVVELTIALHRAFDSPATPVVFDTGHQAYVHKLLTGRRDGFGALRARGGLSGYPNRGESVHDLVENSHASTALSYADGLSKAFELAGEQERVVVAVVGDGALTGGLAWEALNNIGAARRPVVVVVNDNGRSYSPTVGALAAHLSRRRDRAGYDALLELLGGGLSTQPGEGPAGSHARRVLTGSDDLFSALGFAYLGPVDGHDVQTVQTALETARDLRRPAVVHCVTQKGRGYAPAELDPADNLHTVPASGQRGGHTWTDAFADALVDIGGHRPDVVAVSAAMLGPTGLQRFADRFPDRCFDAGIAEAHAVTSAAGLAMGGAHPVVALYATFANRAFDQTLLDVALHDLPVTLVLDRAGITGPDGPSHHGMWDLALLGIVPGMRVAAPRDATRLRLQLEQAVDARGPTAVRFPKATVGADLPAVGQFGTVDLLRTAPSPDLLLVAVGPLAGAALDAARTLASDGVQCTVVDPGWVLPVDDSLVELTGEHRLAVTVEDGVTHAGVGAHLATRLAAAGSTTPVLQLGLPRRFVPHGGRSDLLAAAGLDAPGIASAVCRTLRAMGVRGALRVVARRA
ncbi:MAG TPA: 1-deoxy-D-xylulose-5-phosphate synthase [Actinomycetales bacterium]|nr:1-deoxy-D-xylulose-5-phosphate synthase [Actinomycetales bacterium]